MDQLPETTRHRPQPSANGYGADGRAPVAVAKPPFVVVQHGWLKRQWGQAVSIRLQSGEVITGVLDADDSYTLALRIPGAAETALVYKHSIDYLVLTGRR